MKGELVILDSSGHTALEYDAEDATKLDPAFVESEFQRLVKGGHLAFTEVENPKTGKRENKQIRDFKPGEHERVTMTPAFVGG